MDPLLIERWTASCTIVPTLDEASLALARERVRSAGASIGMDEVTIGSLLIVVSELGMNQLVHGRGGVIGVRTITRGGVSGLEIVAADRGGGIRAPEEAIDGTGSKKGLGIGLSGAMRLSNEVDFDVRLGQGTCIRARKFAAPVPRRREVGVFGRPCQGEVVSGDDAAFLRLGDMLIVGLADGLGHGPEAQEAAIQAMAVLVASAARRPEETLTSADLALLHSRGAVMSVAHLDEDAGHLSFAGAGNIGTRLYGVDGQSRSYAGPGLVLGQRHHGVRPHHHEEQAKLGERDVLVMFSDGLSSRARVSDDRALLRQHPIVVAQRLFEGFARDHDDATVLVAG